MSYSTPRFPHQRWQIAAAQPDAALNLMQTTHLPLLLTQVLINRGVDTPEAARLFLEPELQSLPSPLDEFPDLPIALDLLLRAISTHQPIAICGDYDADGMTSTALLLRALRYLGAIVDYAIPSRMQEGYGINRRIIEEFYEDGVALVLTVDNGIAAVEPIARARELGLTVIVTDHHDIPETLPPANAILNPKLIREDSPYRGVAGVGVAYILAICLAQCLQKTQDLTAPLLELFTLGTIADLAPLTGVNRRWVRRGLKLLPKSRIPGVQALIQVAGLSQEKALKPEAIGFRLGPRINAVGRIADPQIVIELLTSDDDGQALELAMKCEQVNQLRQRLCELIEQEAIAWCEQNEWRDDRVLVVVQPDWHHGVIGIVASRLVERYGVPVFIGTYEDEQQQQIRGSARGIPEFHVFEALQFCGEVLEKFGGHRAAGGFSLKAEHLSELRLRLSLFANHQLLPEHLQPLVAIDTAANFNELTLTLYEQLDALHPCGIENPDPIFWTPNVRIVEQQRIGRNRDHLKLTLSQISDPTVAIRAIAWRWGDYHPLPSPVDIAYRLRLNEWNGTKSVELELVGVRAASVAGLAALDGLEPLSPIADRPPQPSPLISPTRTADKPAARSLSLFGVTNDATGAMNGSANRGMNGSITDASSSLTGDSTTDEIADQIAIDMTDDMTDDATGDLTGDRNKPQSDSVLELDEAQLPLRKVDFYYNTRKYTGNVLQTTTTKELRIRNSEGQVLVIQPRQRHGFLGKRRDDARPVDISQPHYFNLIRAALDALEIAEKTALLQEKEQQVAELNQQIIRLQERLQHAEPAQPVSAPERPVAARPSLQLTATPLKPEEIKRHLKTTLGDRVWSGISPQSQKDLVAAQKCLQPIQEFTSEIIDYSEAGQKLGFVAERELAQLFFKQLYAFVQAAGDTSEVAGITLRARKKYTLELLPPLLAPDWQSWRIEALNSSQPIAPQFCTVTAPPVSPSDRQRIQSFLQQWQHPLARWLLHTDAASTIAQLDALKTIAAHPASFLHHWQFEWLHLKLLGSDTTSGVLQAIYASD